MIERKTYIQKIITQFEIHRIVALLGPRQCGKTTLAKQIQDLGGTFEAQNYFDLEDPLDYERLSNPRLALKELKGLIIIDEVQRFPDLFPILRYLHDEDPKKKFLLLGSASRALLQQSSESLAGRIGYIEVTPFQAQEVDNWDQLWIRGGFPKSYLARSQEQSFLWRRDYVRTYIEQDIPSLGFKILPSNIQRFWMMITHYHGQQFNGSEIAKSLNLSQPTVRHYLDILANTFMIRMLQPWFENISKRQVKSPKIYIRDSGILNYFLRIQSKEEIQTYPKLGSLWEGFVLEQLITNCNLYPEDCYYWATQNQAELDLLTFQKGKRIGYEVKYTDAPKITPSMKIALEDLSLDHLFILYPGEKSYPLSDVITVTNLQNMISSN